MFGFPGAVAKSSISLFRRKPSPGATRAFPKESFNVVVTATAPPDPSTTEKCVVEGRSPGRVGIDSDGVARIGWIEAAIRFSRAGSVNSRSRTPGNAGSPR